MKKKSGLRTAIFCSVITLVVAAGMSFLDPAHWTTYLYASFIFSFSIGFSIAILLFYFSAVLMRLSVIARTGALIVLFLIGGCIGTEVGTFILGAQFAFRNQLGLLVFNLFLSIIFGSIAFVYFSLQEKAQRMAVELKEKDVREAKMQQLKTQAELDALQTKVNPHFLFNTLNSIASLISENPAAAESTVEKLSELFRYTLQSTERSTVKLTEELEIVRLYLQIEKIRFGKRLEFEIVCDEKLTDIDIPALLVQPLVENAIKHGIAPEVDGGRIRVEALMTEGECQISVTDSGKGFTSEAGEPGFGLKSIRERLQLIYGAKARLNIVQDGITHITISLPI
jgi:two-component system, LytTR family, sensor kinase